MQQRQSDGNSHDNEINGDETFVEFLIDTQLHVFIIDMHNYG